MRSLMQKMGDFEMSEEFKKQIVVICTAFMAGGFTMVGIFMLLINLDFIKNLFIDNVPAGIFTLLTGLTFWVMTFSIQFDWRREMNK
jgi:hypothetical protein